MKPAIIFTLCCSWPLLIIWLPIIDFLEYGYIDAFIPHLTTLAVVVLIDFLLIIIERKYSIWSKFGHWQKYFYLSFFYTICMISSPIFSGILADHDKLFINSAPEGHSIMLYGTSVFFFIPIGFIYCIIKSLDSPANKKKSR